MNTDRSRAILALLLTMLIWGTSAVFLRTTALTLAPENALALRFVLLVAMIVPILAITGGWHTARQDWPRLLLASVAGFGSFWFTIQGFARVAAGTGTVVSLVEPFIIAVLFWLVLGERLSRRTGLGLIVALAGAVVLFWPDITATTASPVDPVGIAFLVAAPTCFAVYTLAAKTLLTRYSAFAITAWTTLVAAPPVLLLASKPWADLLTTTSARTWAELFYLAAFNTLIGTVLWNYGTRHLPGAVVGAFLYLLPVVAVIAGWLVLAEPITPWLVAGGAIMMAGVALAQSSPRQP
jgi:drug/metabolite transporter (DMT)-like permease